MGKKKKTNYQELTEYLIDRFKSEHILQKITHKNKAITGNLKNSGITITIRPKEPKDWHRMFEYYREFPDKLYEDIIPFMGLGWWITQEKKTLNEDRQRVIDLLKIQSGLLHGFLRGVIKANLDLRDLPSLKSAIKEAKDSGLVIDWKDTKLFTQVVIETVYSEYIQVAGIRGFNEGFDSDNFDLTYIKQGERLLRSEDGRYWISELHTFQTFMTIGTEPHDDALFKLLYTITKSTGIPESIDISPDKFVCNPSELTLIRKTIKKAFPNLNL